MFKPNAVVIGLNDSELLSELMWSEECEVHEKKDYFEELSNNLLLHILSFLPARSLMVASEVCRRWRLLSRDQSLWIHPRVYLSQNGHFYNTDSTSRELFRLLKYAPCDSFDRLEVCFGPSDPAPLHDAILQDKRSVRSLFVSFSLSDCSKIISLLRRHSLTLQKLQILVYDALRLSGDTDNVQLLRGIWLEIGKMKSLKSLSLDRSLTEMKTPASIASLDLEELEIGYWGDNVFNYVLDNRDSLKIVKVGGSYHDNFLLLEVLGVCPNIEEVTVPCVKNLSFLGRCPLLTRLTIVEGPDTDSYIASFLMKSRYLSSKLRSLRLRKLDGYIFKAISSTNMPSLKTLWIQECYNFPLLEETLKDLPLLEELHLKYQYFNFEEWTFLRCIRSPTLLPKLRTLRVSGWCGFGPGGFTLCVHKECQEVINLRPKLMIFVSEGCFCNQRNPKTPLSKIHRILQGTLMKLETISTEVKTLQNITRYAYLFDDETDGFFIGSSIDR